MHETLGVLSKLESAAAEQQNNEKIQNTQDPHLGLTTTNSTLLLYRSRADFLESCNQPLLLGTDNSPFWIVFVFCSLLPNQREKDGTIIFCTASNFSFGVWEDIPAF